MTAATTQRAIDLLSEAVQINSVNPLQAGPRSGSGGESAIANWVGDYARTLGADVTLDEAGTGRPNIYAMFEGSSQRTIAVDVHLDTVGIEHMTDDPFDGRVEDGKLFGRGSVDTKASFAVLLALLEQFRADGTGPTPNLLLVGTVGEEGGGFQGATRFAEWVQSTELQIDALVVAEPTLCAPVHGHKGGLGLDICVHGLAAHSSRPELGRNAIAGAAKVIDALVAENDRITAQPPTTAVGTGTVAVTGVTGGLAPNIIPDRCDVHVGRRIAPGEDPAAVFDDLRTLATDAASPLDVEVTLTDGKAYPAFYQEADAAVVQQLATLSETEPEVATYGTNALAYGNLLGSAVREVVIFGPGSIDQAHQAVEWVAVSELDKATRVYRDWLLGDAESL